MSAWAVYYSTTAGVAAIFGEAIMQTPRGSLCEPLLCHGKALEIQSTVSPVERVKSPGPRSFWGQERHHVDLKSRAPKVYCMPDPFLSET